MNAKYIRSQVPYVTKFIQLRKQVSVCSSVIDGVYILKNYNSRCVTNRMMQAISVGVKEHMSLNS